MSLEQVETVPVGEMVLDLATPAPSKKTDAGAPKTAKERSIPLLIGAACVYMALAALLARGLTEEAERARGAGGFAAGGAGHPRAAGVHCRGLWRGYGLFGAWAGKMATAARRILARRAISRLSARVYAGVVAARPAGQGVGASAREYGVSGADEACADCLRSRAGGGLLQMGRKSWAKARRWPCRAAGAEPGVHRDLRAGGRLTPVPALLLVLMLLYARRGAVGNRHPDLRAGRAGQAAGGLLAPLGGGADERGAHGRAPRKSHRLLACWAAWRRRLSSRPLWGETSSRGWWINTRRRLAIRTRRLDGQPDVPAGRQLGG